MQRHMQQYSNFVAFGMLTLTLGVLGGLEYTEQQFVPIFWARTTVVAARGTYH